MCAYPLWSVESGDTSGAKMALVAESHAEMPRSRPATQVPRDDLVGDVLAWALMDCGVRPVCQAGGLRLS